MVVESVELEERGRRLWTAADLAALPDELPSGTVDYELWEGELRRTAPPSDEHAGVGAPLITALTTLGQWRGHGLARDDVGVMLGSDPDTVVGPDAAFLTSDQLPVQRSPEGYLVTMPALMAEIRSKNNTWKDIERKTARYLAKGCRLVWVLDPKRRRILVHRPDTEATLLTEKDTLTAEGVIPGFEFPVHRLFEGI